MQPLARRNRAMGAMFSYFFGGAGLLFWNDGADPHRWWAYGMIAVAACSCLHSAATVVTTWVTARSQ